MAEKPDLDAELVFDRPLARDELDTLADLLLEHAPRWAAGLRIWRTANDERLVDAHSSGALARAVLTAVGERGETSAKLVNEYGLGDDRAQGTAELRGAGADLFVIVSVDARVFSRLAGRGHLGNEISVQVRPHRVEGVPAQTWLRRFFASACARLAPAWAAAYARDEYWAKVMAERPVVRAVGRDFARFLPGLFWLNFFGARYTEFIGGDRLRSAPAKTVEDIDSGVLLTMGEDPLQWASDERRAAERAVLDVIGEDVFFSSDAPGRVTRAPSWRS